MPPTPNHQPLAGQSIKFFCPIAFACTAKIQDGVQGFSIHWIPPSIAENINMQASRGARKNDPNFQRCTHTH
uniref:MIP22649p n=1 Tax=Drosophila melanogaster TaxID=7227 RepID=D6W4M9_DROME|nr:MIP22649p [Drosophila melanogaster]